MKGCIKLKFYLNIDIVKNQVKKESKLLLFYLKLQLFFNYNLKKKLREKLIFEDDKIIKGLGLAVNMRL